MTGMSAYASKLLPESEDSLRRGFADWARGIPLAQVLRNLNEERPPKAHTWTPRRFFQRLFIRGFPVPPDLDIAWDKLHAEQWKRLHSLGRELGVPPWAIVWALLSKHGDVDAIRATLVARLGEPAIARSLAFWKIYDPPRRRESLSLTPDDGGSFFRELRSTSWVDEDRDYWGSSSPPKEEP